MGDRPSYSEPAQDPNHDVSGAKQGGGQRYEFRSGFWVEPQHFPDSPNHPEFPSTVLKQGESYHSTIVYHFTTRSLDVPKGSRLFALESGHPKPASGLSPQVSGFPSPNPSCTFRYAMGSPSMFTRTPIRGRPLAGSERRGWTPAAWEPHRCRDNLAASSNLMRSRDTNGLYRGLQNRFRTLLEPNSAKEWTIAGPIDQEKSATATGNPSWAGHGLRSGRRRATDLDSDIGSSPRLGQSQLNSRNSSQS